MGPFQRETYPNGVVASLKGALGPGGMSENFTVADFY
jgi:hypothetical protein